MKIISIASFLFLGFLNPISTYSQDKPTQSVSGDHTAYPCFGGLTGGSISIAEALDDSLAFTDSVVNARMHIVSFNLALKCNGNTIKYLENKKGNKLTPEMKEAIQKLHQNCTLNFDGIKSRMFTKDMNGKYTEIKHKGLVLKVQ